MIAATAPRGLVDLVEHREQGADRRRAPHDPHDDLRHDAERPFRAHEETDEVVALRVPHLAAEPDDLAVGQHDLEPEDVVRRDPVFQGVGAARVVGDVPADRAGELARGIGHVVEARRGERLGEVEVHQARLDHRELVRVVDLEDARHAGERDDDAALGREAPAGKPRSGAARDERQPFRVGEPDAGGHFRRAARETDRVGHRAEDGEPVRLVDHELVRLGQNTVRADDHRERRPQARPRGLGEWRHRHLLAESFAR